MEEKKMLDNLVESRKNSAENKRIGRYLLTTFVLVFSLFISGVLWSLFGKDFRMNGEDFELSTIVTPILVEDKKPAPVSQPEKSLSNQENELPSRQTNTLNLEETPKEIGKISVTPLMQKARPSGEFNITKGVETDYNGGRRDAAIDNKAAFSASIPTTETEKPEIKLPKPPPPIKKEVTEEIKKAAPVSGGVVNGKATSLPKPVYSAAAQAVGARGNVDVQVMIDENGNVISAKAISGHPLLREAAERAARNAKFSPTYLTDKPVKVSGLIVYNFTKN
jgi:periplasmic protein TonB